MKKQDIKTDVWELLRGIMVKSRKDGLDSLNHHQRKVAIAAELDSEVMGSSLFDYYSNPSGNNASILPEALRDLGLTISAELIEEANSLFPAGKPSIEWSERLSQLSGITGKAQKKLAEIEKKYLERPDNFGKSFRKYMEANNKVLAEKITIESF